MTYIRYKVIKNIMYSELLIIHNFNINAHYEKNLKQIAFLFFIL